MRVRHGSRRQRVGKLGEGFDLDAKRGKVEICVDCRGGKKFARSVAYLFVVFFFFYFSFFL